MNVSCLYRTVYTAIFSSLLFSPDAPSNSAPKSFSIPEISYIRRYCYGDEYHQWIKLSSQMPFSDYLLNAGFSDDEAEGSGAEILPLRRSLSSMKKREESGVLEIVPKGQVTLRPGQRFLSFCWYNDRPLERMQWFKDGQYISKSDSRRPYGYGLDLDSVTLNDAGVYTCCLDDQCVSSTVTVTQDIELEGAKVTTANLNSTAILECNVAHAIPVPDRQWWYRYSPDRPDSYGTYLGSLIYGTYNQRYTIIEGGGLQIESVQEDDYGTYTCWQQSPRDFESRTVELLHPGTLFILTNPEHSLDHEGTLSAVNPNIGLCAYRSNIDDDRGAQMHFSEDSSLAIKGPAGRLNFFGFSERPAEDKLVSLGGATIKVHPLDSWGKYQKH